MKPFNLKEASEGKPVCTRDGRDVRILVTDCKSPGNHYPVVALVTNAAGEEAVISFTKEGRFNTTDTDYPSDLMMKTTTVTRWINVYHTPDTVGIYHNGGTLYDTKEEARQLGEQCFNYLATVPVEFEV